MGTWQGGQAEYLRMLRAHFMALKLPPDAEQKQVAYVMCADIISDMHVIRANDDY
jgi:glutathione-independent formaldehyde dehydrogenase